MSEDSVDAGSSRRTRDLIFYLFTILAFLGGILLSIVGDYLNGSFFHGTWAEFLGDLLKHGGSIIGVFAVFALISDKISETSIINEFSNNLARKIQKLIFEVFPGVEDVGLTAIHDEMRFDQLFASLGPGDELFWLDTYSPGLKVWIREVERAAERGAILNFMVLNPNSRFVELRAQEISSLFSYKKFKNELELFIDDLMETKKAARATPIGLNIKQYDGLLGCPIYLIRRDSLPFRAYSSVYLRKATGQKFPHFEWIRSGRQPFIDELAQYVDWRWSVAEAIASSDDQNTSRRN